MKVSYKKLWKVLIDNHLKKKDNRYKADLSVGTMKKLSNDECVNLSILLKIFEVLNCDICDIVETIK